MRKKIVGIASNQWILILIAIGIVVLINAIDMSQWFRIYEREAKLINYAWSSRYSYEVTWLKIIREGLLMCLLLTAFAWLAVFISIRAFFQKFPAVLKYILEAVLAVWIGVVYTYASINYAYSWIYDIEFCSIFCSGILKPIFVINWSMRIVLPGVTALTFWAMCISNQIKNRELSSVLIPAGPG